MQKPRLRWFGKNCVVLSLRGGLGLKKLEEWNRAATLKHIWSLFAQSGSIWVAWVDSYWLKGRSLWNISIPKVCSWSWKKLLNLRETAKKFISFKVGEGTSISLWFDLWHPAGRLLDTYVFRIVYDIGSILDARLSSVIKDRK
jgi:hypothetical protein